ncbi:MAG: sigma-54-dependent Fis family transcriptional regulator, partial [Nitrospirae bacterium]|nr:sigma-54-dependent Fis family transcriptional regulator [Nitrospirota bacterium]
DAAVRAGTFREDLYYRLHVVPIVLPPLRDRAEDIPLLVDTFLQKFAVETGKPVAGIAPGVLDALTSYRWPGNVRELEHVIERMVIMSRSTVLDVKDMPPSLRAASRPAFIPAGTMTEAVRKVERGMIVQALEEAGWVKARAAKRLGVTVRILAYKMGKYGISERGGEKDAGARHQARPA